MLKLLKSPNTAASLSRPVTNRGQLIPLESRDSSRILNQVRKADSSRVCVTRVDVALIGTDLPKG